jgi:ABC-type sugar transport system substrate-binding protein
MISQGFILNNAEQFSGGILIASVFGDGHIEELNAFARGITIPLVIVDHIPPPAVKGDASNTSPSNVVWVTASDLNGGHKAAEAVGDLKIDPTRILVVAGPAKADRQNGFKASIEHRWPACRVRVTTNGGFDRQTAEQVAHNLLSASIKDSSLYDVVFCTSDAMTLGVLDAIASLDWTKCAKPHVIGYDGIAATKRLVLRQDSPLKRVVVQDAKAMASEAVQALLKLKSKLAVPQTIWIEPTLFLDVNELVDRDPALVDP